MLILGISGSSNRIDKNDHFIGATDFHDSAAALIHDGRLICSYEEERFNRIKHTNKLPVGAIKACLQTYGVALEQIDYFSFSQSEEGFREMLRYMGDGQVVLQPRAFLRKILEDEFKTGLGASKFEMFEHHFAHAATAFYPSLFEEALVVTIDGSGGEYSGSVYKGKGNSLLPIKAYATSQSLGHFYMFVTQILGFGDFDEYKVMGLAPYGDPSVFRKLFNTLYTLLPNGEYQVHFPRLDELRRICPGRHKTTPFLQEHKDIAAALQESLERIVFHIVEHFKRTTGQRNLCLAGGVALNCTLNGRLINSGLFDDVFVYPAANDSGLPVGSALAAYFKYTAKASRYPLGNLYLGSGIGDSGSILKALDLWQDLISYERLENISLAAAKLLADNQVIGWVQGRSEFAPRALGNRSILADPRPAENKERINLMVKKRESFRPFAPSVLVEDAPEYFELPPGQKIFPYMMFTLKVKEKYRNILGAVTHIDGSARVQTVSKEDNPRYWDLINEFKTITGIPVVLNTSFNNNYEPIVDSVTDAIVTFLTTKLDYLIVGDYLVSKSEVSIRQLGMLVISIPPQISMRKVETDLPKNGLHPNTNFEIRYSYNNESTPISEEIFNILIQANGDRSLIDVIDELQLGDEEREAEILNECLELWESRRISLTPGERKQRHSHEKADASQLVYNKFIKPEK